jgi:virulence-associated protein VapD
VTLFSRQQCPLPALDTIVFKSINKQAGLLSHERVRHDISAALELLDFGQTVGSVHINGNDEPESPIE